LLATLIKRFLPPTETSEPCREIEQPIEDENTIVIETFADKVFMCNTLYLQGAMVHDIRLLLNDVYGPVESDSIMQTWKQFRNS
jgi:hypothetical protein